MWEWRREKNPWRRQNYSGLSSSFINFSCLEGLYKSHHGKTVCQHCTVYPTGTQLSHNVCLSTDKTVSEVKQYSFYLDSILVEHPNKPPFPNPCSLLLHLKVLPRMKYFFRNKISTQKIPQNLKIVHYTPTLSEDIPLISTYKGNFSILRMLKNKGENLRSQMLPL